MAGASGSVWECPHPRIRFHRSGRPPPTGAVRGHHPVFFQSSAKFKTRYSTLGFNDSARLDDGDLWPTAYAVADLTPAVEKTVSALIAKAAAAQGGA